MINSPTKTYIRSVFQIPTSANKQDVQTLIFFEAQEIHINLDPKLYDWFLYFPVRKDQPFDPQETIKNPNSERGQSVPRTDISNETVSALYKEIKPSSKKGGESEPPKIETKQKVLKKETQSHTANSDKGTLKMSHQKSKYLNRSGSNIRESKDPNRELNKYFLDLISRWFPTLNTALIQVRMDMIHLFVPKRR